MGVPLCGNWTVWLGDGTAGLKVVPACILRCRCGLNDEARLRKRSKGNGGVASPPLPSYSSSPHHGVHSQQRVTSQPSAEHGTTHEDEPARGPAHDYSR